MDPPLHLASHARELLSKARNKFLRVFLALGTSDEPNILLHIDLINHQCTLALVDIFEAEAIVDEWAQNPNTDLMATLEPYGDKLLRALSRMGDALIPSSTPLSPSGGVVRRASSRIRSTPRRFSH